MNIELARARLRLLYTAFEDVAEALDLPINVDGEEGCPPCNTITEEDACIGCQSLKDKRTEVEPQQ